MKKILIYSSNICPYCIAAKKLFESLDLNFQEKIIDNFPEIKKEMIDKSNGRKTVPQVFIGNTHIGGYDDLEVAFKSGKLEEILDEK
ncbi:MAG: glutaredoxin 3 [Alphaproteobacteria bacterium]